jgi:sugar phosphate isomerase/epimerase
MTGVNVMWAGTCKHQPFSERLRTTRLSGCDILSISPGDFKQLVSEGRSAADIRRMADDEGVRVSHLDAVCTWAPRWRPSDVPDEFMPLFDTPVEEFLQIADQLDCESFTAICTAPPNEVSVDELVEPFGDLCRRANGLRVDLEFIPIWGLPDLESAWRIVQETGAANGGILLDFWHFFRGTPDLELLKAIPSDKIHAVQVCDAMLARGVGRTDFEDTFFDRRPLGWGEFPIEEMLSVLAEKVPLANVGPEYLSSRMDGLSPSQVAEVVEETYWSRLRSLGMTPTEQHR